MPNTGSIHSTKPVLAADHVGPPECVAISGQPGVTLSVQSVLLVPKQTENLTAVSLLHIPVSAAHRQLQTRTNQWTALWLHRRTAELTEITKFTQVLNLILYICKMSH